MLFARRRRERRPVDAWADVGRFLEWSLCLKLRSVSSTLDAAMSNACQHVELTKPQHKVARLRQSLKGDATGLFSIEIERDSWDEVVDDVNQLRDWFAGSKPALKRLHIASKFKGSRQSDCAASLTALLANALTGVSSRHLVEISVVHGGASTSLACLERAPPQRIRFVQAMVFDGSDLSVADMQCFCGVARASQLRGLTTLSLKYCKLSAQQIEPFISAVRNGSLRNIKSVDLSVNMLGDLGVQALCEAVTHGPLEGLPMLERLELRSVGLSAVGMAALCRVVEASALPKLCSLALDGNATGAEGWQLLALAFCQTTGIRLRTLSLRRMRVNHEGFVALAAAWQESASLGSLTAVNFSGNMAGDLGLCALARALTSPNGRNLRKLSVGANDATHLGIGCLFKCLSKSGVGVNLKHLNVSGNTLGVVGSQMLLEYWVSGAFSSLECLNVSWTAIDHSTKQRLQREHVKGCGSMLSLGRLMV